MSFVFLWCILLLIPAGSATITSAIAGTLVESMSLWDGGSRILYVSEESLKPLLIVFENPTIQKDRLKSVLCGTTEDALIVVDPKSMLEKMIRAELKSAIDKELDTAVRNDLKNALEILDDRTVAWPRWLGMSSVDSIRRAIQRDVEDATQTRNE